MGFVSGDVTWGTPRKLKASLPAAVEFGVLLICIFYAVCRLHLIVKKGDAHFQYNCQIHRIRTVSSQWGGEAKSPFLSVLMAPAAWARGVSYCACGHLKIIRSRGKH